MHAHNAQPVQNKSCTLAFCKRPPLAFITERIFWGIVSTTLCNVTTFISTQSCVNFCPRFCTDDRRVDPFNPFKGLKSVVANSCVIMLQSFTTRARWILALLSWNMPEPSGKKKSKLMGFTGHSVHSGTEWFVLPRPDQLKQPQIITGSAYWL